MNDAFAPRPSLVPVLFDLHLKYQEGLGILRSSTVGPQREESVIQKERAIRTSNQAELNSTGAGLHLWVSCWDYTDPTRSPKGRLGCMVKRGGTHRLFTVYLLLEANAAKCAIIGHDSGFTARHWASLGDDLCRPPHTTQQLAPEQFGVYVHILANVFHTLHSRD